MPNLIEGVLWTLVIFMAIVTMVGAAATVLWVLTLIIQGIKTSYKWLTQWKN